VLLTTGYGKARPGGSSIPLGRVKNRETRFRIGGSRCRLPPYFCACGYDFAGMILQPCSPSIISTRVVSRHLRIDHCARKIFLRGAEFKNPDIRQGFMGSLLGR